VPAGRLSTIQGFVTNHSFPKLLQVMIVQRMEDAANSVRTYLTAPNGSPIVRVATVEESKQAALAGDDGLGGGVSVYACLSLKTLGNLPGNISSGPRIQRQPEYQIL
jgi:hypothetical protein